MNTHISRSIVFAATLSVSAIFSACGEDNFSSKPIAPGEECFAGGTLYIVDEEETVVCNGSTRNERVEAGQGSNPCHGPATLVSVQDASGTISQEWFCDGVTRDQLNEEEQTLYDFVVMYIAQTDYQKDILELCEQVDEGHEKALEPTSAASRNKELLACAAYEISGFTGPVFANPDFVRCVVPSSETVMSCLGDLPSEPVGESSSECSSFYYQGALDCMGVNTNPQACAAELGVDEAILEIESSALMIAVQTIVTLCGLADPILD